MPLIVDGDKLEANNKYVMSDFMAKQVVGRFSSAITTNEDLNKYYRKYDGSGLNSKKLLVWRTGGIGDLLFITPSLYRLHQKFSGLEVKLACSKKYLPLFKDHPLLIDKCAHALPFNANLLTWADYHIHFEGIIESGGRAKYIHAIDLFAEYFHLQNEIPMDLRRPILPAIDSVEDFRTISKAIKKSTINLKLPTILFQYKASSPVRTFPKRRIIELAKIIAIENNWNAIVVDSPHEAPEINKLINQAGNPPRLYNAASWVKSIRDTIALVSLVDILVVPDSALCHIAGAANMNKPTIALYGPFPSFVRTSYYPKCIALDADNGCQLNPCFQHGHTPCKNATESGESPCFKSIKTKTILTLLKTMVQALEK
jgi:ADP-heptose:LPS heptosyltransferase